MKNADEIKRVIGDIQRLEILAKNVGTLSTAIGVISNGTTDCVPGSVVPIFRSHLITAVDKAMVELRAEYERLVHESLER